MNNLPKISVVIPCYNAEKFAGKCLDNVLQQSIKDIEVICIDDGSKDNTAQILDEYAAKDSRVIVEHRENSGAARSRNRAIEIATGEFIAFMDSDDFYPDVDVLLDLYNAAKKSGQKIAGGGVERIDVDGKKLNVVEGKDKVGKVIQYRDYQEWFGYWRFIYTTQMLKEGGMKFPVCQRVEDPLFFVKTLNECGSFLMLDRATYCYRVDYKELDFTRVDMVDGVIFGTLELFKYARENELKEIHNKIWKQFFNVYLKWFPFQVLNKRYDGAFKEFFNVCNGEWLGVSKWKLKYGLSLLRLRTRLYAKSKNVLSVKKYIFGICVSDKARVYKHG